MKWIECTKKYATDKSKTHRDVERACDRELGYPSPNPPNCDHIDLFSGKIDQTTLQWVPNIPLKCE